jgi:hypothetical protein
MKPESVLETIKDTPLAGRVIGSLAVAGITVGLIVSGYRREAKENAQFLEDTWNDGYPVSE